MIGCQERQSIPGAAQPLMNPIVYEFGPLTLHAFAAWLLGGVLAGGVLIAWRAYAYRERLADVPRWLDPAIAGLAAGIFGARALHVLVEWDYYAGRTHLITELSSGGLMWQGALLAGLPAALGVARLRGVPLQAWTDALALAVPLTAMAGWLACRDTACAYGYEVRTLAEWPALAVEELPDIYGQVAPRLDIQLAGMALTGLWFLLVLALTLAGWLRGLRVWLVLALIGLLWAILGFFRADPSQMLWDRRVDQVLDLGIFLAASVIGAWIWLLHQQRSDAGAARPASHQPSDTSDIHLEVDSDEPTHRAGPV